MEISWEYFCKELIGFRQIIGLRSYSLEQWEDAWTGLLYVYMQLKDHHEEAVNAINALEIDYYRRVQYRLGVG